MSLRPITLSPRRRRQGVFKKANMQGKRHKNTICGTAKIIGELPGVKLSFKVTIPTYQNAAASLPSIWPEGIRVR